jgi:plasmid maintenance system antidote protein VapI
MMEKGGITQTRLAKEYGVGQTTISDIIRGIRW